MATETTPAMASPLTEPAVTGALSELTALLSPSSPAAPEAASTALALSGSSSGRALLAANPAALSALAALGASASRGASAALGALVNASAEPGALEPLLAALPPLLPLLPSCGRVCGLLANVCRESEAVPRVLRALGAEQEEEEEAMLLLRAMRAPRPPEELGALLCNLSGAQEGRAALLESSGRVVRALLALLRCPHSAALREGAAGAVRNCCFQHEHHQWLLGPEVEALPALLLPLAGALRLSPDDMDKLPVDLQFLPPEHQREEEPRIRKMLLEALLLLAATKCGRLHLRSRGSYLVLRELHTWEKNPEVLTTCQKLIQVLIGDEPEAGMENLLEVTIPEELERRLRELDRQQEEQSTEQMVQMELEMSRSINGV